MKTLIFFLIVFCSLVFAQNEDWLMEEEMRLPVAGGQTITDRENIYVLGGYSDSTQSNVDWIQKYSTFLHIWKLRTKTMHSPRYGFIAEVDDEIDSVYYFGGVSEGSEQDKNVLETWGITNSVTNIRSHHPDFNRKFATGVLANKKLYIIGGNHLESSGSDSSYSYIVEYSLAGEEVTYQSSDIYASSSELPEQQMSALYENYIFIFGGANNGIKNDIYRFNIETHKFDTLDVKLSVPRAAGKAVLRPQRNQIYIIGGYNEENDAINSVDILNVDDENNYSISSAPNLNIGRSNFMANEVEDNIYVMGGYDLSGDLISEIEILTERVTAVKDEKKTPDSYMLHQNYPNPFNPETKIKYNLKKETKAKLVVYDILGNKLRELVNERQSAGTYEVSFSAENLSSGIYVYELTAGEFKQSKKMILLR